MKSVPLIAAIVAVLGVILSLLANAAMWMQLHRLDNRHQRETVQANVQRDLLTRQLAAQQQSLGELRTKVERESAIQEKHGAEGAARLKNLLDQMGARTPTALPFGTPLLGGFTPLGGNNAEPLKGRGWGPEQATGEPDTLQAGDQQTAWASQSQDEQEEWLQLEYNEVVAINKVKVYETFNPGALFRITSVDDDGKETEIWKGKDPTPVGSAMGVSEIPIAPTVKSKRVKLYLDSVHVPGWNEIDAVGLVDDVNTVHWALRATASSTFAEPRLIPGVFQPVKPPKQPPNEAF